MLHKCGRHVRKRIGRAVAQTYAFTLACLGTAGRDNLLRVSEFRGSKKGSTLVEGGGSA